MGEYATYQGQRIKIGTCENMYYLRWDQRLLVDDSELNLVDPKTLDTIRFRFPWPDEDDRDPGDFEDPFRGLTLWGFGQPKGLGHGLAQFTAQNGYLVSLPCPEDHDYGHLRFDGPDGKPDGYLRPYQVGRNGYGGPAQLVQQALRGGRLVGIARCNGCGTHYRLQDGYESTAAISIRVQADREIRTADQADGRSEGNRAIGQELHRIADRLLAAGPESTFKEAQIP